MKSLTSQVSQGGRFNETCGMIITENLTTKNILEKVKTKCI